VSVVLELCEKFGNTGVNKKIHATCEAPTKITLTVQNKTYCYYYIIIIILLLLLIVICVAQIE